MTKGLTTVKQSQSLSRRIPENRACTTAMSTKSIVLQSKSSSLSETIQNIDNTENRIVPLMEVNVKENQLFYQMQRREEELKYMDPFAVCPLNNTLAVQTEENVTGDMLLNLTYCMSISF